MRRLSDTIERLTAARDRLTQSPPAAIDRLRDMAGVTPDPGQLRARLYVPVRLQPDPALVVVLHGCTQTAAGYDTGSGWSRLADEQGFVLLFPEQRRANNANLCFNWFVPDDIARDRGEAGSIRAMVAAVVKAHGIDPARIFVTGLSAGGAMTAVMLATYPDVFAGGAIIGGLPYGTASGVVQALDRMRGHDLPDARTLTDLVHAASRHAGPWPTLSLWHGEADATVQAANAEALLEQWRGLHGVGPQPARRDSAAGHVHRRWHDAAGRTVIEDHRIAAMGHGTPIATQGPEACGVAGPYMLDVGLSSTRRIAAFWELAPAVGQGDAPPVVAGASPSPPSPPPPPLTTATGPGSGIGAAIDGALRAAGLLR